MQIDTGGRNLSQGERQLVNLARAILRRSPIVILDEVSAPSLSPAQTYVLTNNPGYCVHRYGDCDAHSTSVT